MAKVLDADRRALDLRVAREIGADEPPIPWPLILGVACRVDADKPATQSDVSFQGCLLVPVEDVSGRAEKHNHLVLAEKRVAEPRSIFRAVDRKPMLGAEPMDGGDPLRN